MERVTLERIVDAIHGGTITKVEQTIKIDAGWCIQLTVEAKNAPTILLRVPLHPHHEVEAIVLDDRPQEIPGQLSMDDTPTKSPDTELYQTRVEEYACYMVQHEPGCTGTVEWHEVGQSINGTCDACGATS